MSTVPTKPGFYWFRFKWKDSPWQPCEVNWKYTGTGVATDLVMTLLGSSSIHALSALNIKWGPEIVLPEELKRA